METNVKPKYRNLIYLLLAVVGGFFVPLLGVGALLVIEFSGDARELQLTKDERTMTRIALIILAIYFVINIALNITLKTGDTSESSLASLLKLLIFIE